MANTATVLGSTGSNISYHGARVVPVKVIIDTINTDIALYDTPSDERCCVLGITYGLAAAHNLTITSASTVLDILILPADSALVYPVGQGILWAGLAAGDDLKLASSVAIASMLVYLGFYKQVPIS